MIDDRLEQITGELEDLNFQVVCLSQVIQDLEKQRLQLETMKDSMK